MRCLTRLDIRVNRKEVPRLTLGIRVRRESSLSKIIRTPFGVLLPFVTTKQKALHYLSFRQTVAHQEGNLTSKQARPAHGGRGEVSGVILKLQIITNFEL